MIRVWIWWLCWEIKIWTLPSLPNFDNKRQQNSFESMEWSQKWELWLSLKILLNNRSKDDDFSLINCLGETKTNEDKLQKM